MNGTRLAVAGIRHWFTALRSDVPTGHLDSRILGECPDQCFPGLPRTWQLMRIGGARMGSPGSDRGATMNGAHLDAAGCTAGDRP